MFSRLMTPASTTNLFNWSIVCHRKPFLLWADHEPGDGMVLGFATIRGPLILSNPRLYPIPTGLMGYLWRRVRAWMRWEGFSPIKRIRRERTKFVMKLRSGPCPGEFVTNPSPTRLRSRRAFHRFLPIPKGLCIHRLFWVHARLVSSLRSQIRKLFFFWDTAKSLCYFIRVCSTWFLTFSSGGISIWRKQPLSNRQWGILLLYEFRCRQCPRHIQGATFDIRFCYRAYRPGDSLRVTDQIGWGFYLSVESWGRLHHVTKELYIVIRTNQKINQTPIWFENIYFFESYIIYYKGVLKCVRSTVSWS